MCHPCFGDLSGVLAVLSAVIARLSGGVADSAVRETYYKATSVILHST